MTSSPSSTALASAFCSCMRRRCGRMSRKYIATAIRAKGARPTSGLLPEPEDSWASRVRSMESPSGEDSECDGKG